MILILYNITKLINLQKNIQILFDSCVLVFQIIFAIAVVVILQQCFIGDCLKVGVKKDQQWNHKHDPVNCDHPSHKHEHDHDHEGHSGHDHSGHNHGNHNAGTAGKTKTGPVRSTSPKSNKPRSIEMPPRKPSGGDNGEYDDMLYDQQHDHASDNHRVYSGKKL